MSVAAMLERLELEPGARAEGSRMMARLRDVLEGARGEVRAGWYDARHPRRVTRPTVAEARRVGTRCYVLGYVARMARTGGAP